MAHVLQLVFSLAVAVGLVGSVVVLLLRGTRWDVVGRRASRGSAAGAPGWREGSPVARFVAGQPSARTTARPSPVEPPISTPPPVGCYSGARSRGYGAVGGASRSQ